MLKFLKHLEPIQLAESIARLHSSCHRFVPVKDHRDTHGVEAWPAISGDFPGKLLVQFALRNMWAGMK